MMVQLQMKCPEKQCGAPAPLDAVRCARCGHVFRTVFDRDGNVVTHDRTTFVAGSGDGAASPDVRADEYSCVGPCPDGEITSETVLRHVVAYLDHLMGQGTRALEADDMRNVLQIQDALAKIDESHSSGRNWATGLAAGVGLLVAGPVGALGAGWIGRKLATASNEEAHTLAGYAKMRLQDVKRKYGLGLA